VVTGSSAGIGRHLAVELVTRLGMRVAGCARRLRKLTELGAELRAAGFADNFLPLQCDLTKDASIVHMFEEVDKHWGRVDVMINNAGIGHTDTVLEGAQRACCCCCCCCCCLLQCCLWLLALGPRASVLAVCGTENNTLEAH